MINKVILVGRLGRDPEMKSTPSGTTVTKFSVATDERFTDRSGEKQERTEWHNCEAWGKLGDICGQYLKKGKLVYIEGKINTDKWEKDGQTKYFTKVKVSEMKMLEARGSESSGGGYSSNSDSGPSAPPEDDDVPF